MLKSTFHRASLNNKLANIITESDQGGKLPAAEIKALVSGEAMTVDHKFGHPFVMEPFATLFWATNQLTQKDGGYHYPGFQRLGVTGT